jgi:DNA-directed RNA polymerase subunit K/omega
MEIPLDRAGTHKSLLLALKEIKDNYAEIENSTE